MTHAASGKQEQMDPAPFGPDELAAIDGELRVRDSALAARLGYRSGKDFRRTIEFNADELRSYGTLAEGRIGPAAPGSGSVVEYWLNEAQALLLSSFLRTSKAPAVRRLLTAAGGAWRAGLVAGEGEDHLAGQLAVILREMGAEQRVLRGELRTALHRIELLEARQSALERMPRHRTLPAATAKGSVAGFLRTGIMAVPGERVPTGDLYAAYKEWCSAENTAPESRNALFRAAREAGWRQRKRSRWFFMDMRLIMPAAAAAVPAAGH